MWSIVSNPGVAWASSAVRPARRHTLHAAVSAPPLVSRSRSHPLPRLPLMSTPRVRTRTMVIPYYCSGERSLVAEDAGQRSNKEWEARIKKELLEPELSPSPYDTAWVAMVPLQGSPQTPCFPQCVEWILQSQQHNGSWGIDEFDYVSNRKCDLLSTLACVIALKKWNVGLEHIKRGLHYVGTNFSIVMDEKITAPTGYNITFTGLISLAIEMGLKFPVGQTDVDTILQIRQMELNRYARDKSYGKEAYMAYVAEGLGNLLDWNEVMKFQRKNGSLFNSPSTTAAALIYYYDEKALQYLNLLVTKFGNAVPAVFPMNIYYQLSMVDSLEKIGISRHFPSEIISILDTTYSLWLQRDDEIMLDIATCAMAFRLLRMNGYDVSSDELSHVAEASTFYNSLQGYLGDTKSLLELYKAAIVSVSKDELVLENIESWSGNLLTENMCSDVVRSMPILGEVEYALKFPFYATMERLDHRRNIEHFDVIGYQMLKTTYLPCHVNKHHLAFAIEDFTFSQSIYQKELMDLESWVKENMLDQLPFARQKQAYCHLSASATIFPPELSDARISWAKNSVLTSILDDFFDIAGSKEELENLVSLVEKWDAHHDLQFYSERVKILFCAIYATTNKIGVMASAVQNRDVRKHLIELWIDVVRSMMTEAEWSRTQYVPTFDEYLRTANITYVLGPIVLSTLYFLGQELSESVVKDPEYNELFRLMSTCGRLLNDLQTIEKEGIEGTVNSISLLIIYNGGSMSTEAAKKAIQETISSCRRELLRLVLKKGTVVPRPCKELFWKMNQVNHLFYSRTDGYTSQTEMVGAVNAVIHEPLKLQISHPTFAIKSEQQGFLKESFGKRKCFIKDHVLSAK